MYFFNYSQSVIIILVFLRHSRINQMDNRETYLDRYKKKKKNKRYAFKGNIINFVLICKGSSLTLNHNINIEHFVGFWFT